ncbi:protein TIFY 6B-like [Nymphaea colorata]|nr:protein TIFY 6B-like [Nymphaea colorata]
MMERDFLGVAKEGGRGREASSKEEAKERDLCRRFAAKNSVVDARPADSPLMGSPQWPYLNKLPLQQFMTIKGGAHEERSRKIGYDQLSSSGFGPISSVDAYETNRRVPSAAKKSFTLDTNGPHIGQGSHFGLPCATYPAQSVGQGPSTSHHSQELRVFPVSSSSLSASVNSNYYKLYGTAASTSPNGLASVKPFGGVPVTTHYGGLLDMASVSAPSRSIPIASAKPTPSAQLTIFYGGSVNVFEDVPLDKAQAIMFLAGNTQNLMAQVPPTTKPIANGFHINAMKATCSGLSSPVSGTSQLQFSGGHSGVQSAGGSTSTDEVAAAKTMSPLACKIQQEPSKGTPLASVATLGPTVPQARKASLARFLEKRKERLTVASPYAKPPEACKEGDHSALDVNVPTSIGE